MTLVSNLHPTLTLCPEGIHGLSLRLGWKGRVAFLTSFRENPRTTKQCLSKVKSYIILFLLLSNLGWTPVSLGSVHQCPIVQYLEYVTLALRDQNGDHRTEGPAHITLHITDTDKGQWVALTRPPLLRLRLKQQNVIKLKLMIFPTTDS